MESECIDRLRPYRLLGTFTAVFRLNDALLGFAAGLALLLIPYILGGMGAGDVKLLGLIGALKGSGFVLETFIYMAVIGAMLAILVILMRGGFKKSFGVGMPYGVAIAGGAVLALLMDVELL